MFVLYKDEGRGLELQIQKLLDDNTSAAVWLKNGTHVFFGGIGALGLACCIRTPDFRNVVSSFKLSDRPDLTCTSAREKAAVAISPCGRMFALHLEKCTRVHFIEAESPVLINPSEQPLPVYFHIETPLTIRVTKIAWSPNGKYFALLYNSRDDCAKSAVEIYGGERKVVCSDGISNDFAWSPNSECLIACGPKGLYGWNVKGELVFYRHEGFFGIMWTNIAWSRDHIAVGGHTRDEPSQVARFGKCTPHVVILKLLESDFKVIQI